jgi:hypothetical protein
MSGPWAGGRASRRELVVLARPVGRVLRTTVGMGAPHDGDHALVDPPGRLDLDALVRGEPARQPLLLVVGDQAGSVCRVRRAR